MDSGRYTLPEHVVSQLFLVLRSSVDDNVYLPLSHTISPDSQAFSYRAQSLGVLSSYAEWLLPQHWNVSSNYINVVGVICLIASRCYLRLSDRSPLFVRA